MGSQGLLRNMLVLSVARGAEGSGSRGQNEGPDAMDHEGPA